VGKVTLVSGAYDMRRFSLRVVEWLGQHEAAVLLGILIPVVGAWAFIELADKVMEGRTQHLDERIIRALRRPNDPTTPIGPLLMVDVARDVSALGGSTVTVLVTGLVAGFLLLDQKKRAALFVIAATGTGFVLSTALKAVYRRPRPEDVYHLVQVHTTSFPSGHSMMSAVVYLTLGALLARQLAERRLKFYVLAVAVLLTGMIGATRVYLGVHYPTDVLAGWCAGLVWGSLCWLVDRWLQRRGVIEKES
jgi:undecaprenyl-diphosphatase